MRYRKLATLKFSNLSIEVKYSFRNDFESAIFQRTKIFNYEIPEVMPVEIKAEEVFREVEFETFGNSQ